MTMTFKGKGQNHSAYLIRIAGLYLANNFQLPVGQLYWVIYPKLNLELKRKTLQGFTVFTLLVLHNHLYRISSCLCYKWITS